MKLWITGSKGMLGQDLCALAKRDFEVFESDREVDITDEAAVSGYISANKPDLIINCAAYTAVDKAETETELNHKLNAIAPQILGEAAAKINAGVIHISTDYAINPINAYGKAKAEGESLLAQANKNHWIVRTAWLYGIHGGNFVKSMLNLMRSKDEISVVNDQKGNPTWTYDLAAAILKIAKNPVMPGIYNFSGEGTTNWYEFAVEIQNQAFKKGLLKREIPISPISSAEWKSLAKRPENSALDKTDIKKIFGAKVPKWQDSLAGFLSESQDSLSKYLELEI